MQRHFLNTQYGSKANGTALLLESEEIIRIYNFPNALYPIIIIIWSKMAQLGLEESSEVEGFRRPKYTQMKAEHSI